MEEKLDALKGLRILVVGLGREGIALTRFLAENGLPVAATDLRSAAELGADVVSLQAAGVSLTLGQHPESLLDNADILFVSPGVPLEVPFLAAARARAIPLTTETRLFCHLCPATIVAITGSSGKTTTTTLVGQMLEASGKKTWVGGNIGRPLISVVDQIAPEDVVVMELSSFQLEYFHTRLNNAVNIKQLPAANPAQLAQLLGNWSPPIAALLNITPNHLDRHPSMKHYVAAKRALLDYQPPGGVIVAGLDNDMARTIGRQFGAKTRWFSLEAQIPGGAGLAAGGKQLAFVAEDGALQPIANTADIKLRGQHNLLNILAACLLCREVGASLEAMQQVATTFAGVDHRLQPAGEHNGVRYFNDSISTTPERLIAALRSFTEPVVLLAGGRDKHLPWDDAARLMLLSARHVVLFGEAAPIIQESITRMRRETASGLQVHRCVNMEEALRQAAGLAQPGSVVLLSPGCASFDEFSSYVARGRRFVELVQMLEVGSKE
ncbi:MAG: UDP-N-acetylmuramoyl-L-alanine--D-glutamate ligase [Anaerolineae bacterium]